MRRLLRAGHCRQLATRRGTNLACSMYAVITCACECPRRPVPLAGSWRYQEIGNDLTPKWAIDKFSAFTHLISQLGHACGRLGLCRPGEFGGPLGIRKIVAVGAPMQTRPQAASLIAYE